MGPACFGDAVVGVAPLLVLVDRRDLGRIRQRDRLRLRVQVPDFI